MRKNGLEVSADGMIAKVRGQPPDAQTPLGVRFVGRRRELPDHSRGHRVAERPMLCRAVEWRHLWRIEERRKKATAVIDPFGPGCHRTPTKIDNRRVLAS